MSPFDLNAYAVTPGTHSLEASAGTGKTFSLVGLILRRVVENGDRLPQILAVTFTKKATGELAERLRAKLTQAADALAEDAPTPKDPQLAHWRQLAASTPGLRATYLARIRTALAEADNCSVFTIHGFCQRVLSECAFESGLALDLDMEDAGEGFTKTAVRDFLRELYAPLANPKAAAEQVAGARLLHDDLGIDTAWLTELARYIAAGNTVTFAPIEPELGPRVVAREALLNFYACRNEALGAHEEDGADLADLRATVNSLANAIPGNAADTQKKTAFKSLADFVALSFAAAFTAKLADIKADAGALTFDDLIVKTAEALTHPETGDRLAAKLRERFKVALIDEFQDTDATQIRIFQKLFTGLPLLYIGDPKQSIYRFRGADLAAYTTAVTGTPEHPVSRAVLDSNFRSTAEMVNAANALFDSDSAISKRGLFPDTGPQVFRPVKAAAKDIPTLKNTAGKPVHALTLVWAEGRTPESAIPAKTAEKRFANDLARRIADLLAGHTLGVAPVRASDIAVLVRTKKQGELIQNVLREAGVPASRTAGSVFADEAAEGLLRLLAAMINPRRSGHLRAALAGPVVGLDAAALRQMDTDDAAYQRHADDFAEAAGIWKKSGVAAAIGFLLARKSLAESLLARADGERLLADLRQLVELAHTRERTAHHSPEALLSWLEAEVHAASASSLASDANRQRLESDRDCVTIMTMHAAKGLEFPIVFVPYAWDFSNRPAKFSAASLNGSRSVALKANHKELAACEETESYHEQARLLYVAVTRAKSACFLYSGLIADKKGSSGIWETPLGHLGPRSEWVIKAAVPGNPRGRSEETRNGTPAITAPITRKNDWKTFAGAHADCIHITDCLKRGATAVPSSDPVTPPPAPLDITPAARAFTARIDRAKIAASYSGITRTLGDAHAGPKAAPESHRHDETLSADLPAAPKAPAEDAPDSIFTFPRGATVGDAVHNLLEDHDFTQPIAQETVAAALRTNGLDADRWARVLTERINAWLDSPLTDADGATFRLRDLPAADRLPEMGFDLTARLHDGQAIADALAGANAPALPTSLLADLRKADLPELDGWLTGFIDLIFRRNGRYYILDWKTNHLGHAIDAYTPDAIGRAMEEHRYHLQYHFYLVALDAHLRACLPGYDPARHLGGVYYLFVRGLDPEKTGYGVFRADAEPGVINALAGALGHAAN